jgi:hypothetical protein
MHVQLQSTESVILQLAVFLLKIKNIESKLYILDELLLGKYTRKFQFVNLSVVIVSVK